MHHWKHLLGIASFLILTLALASCGPAAQPTEPADEPFRVVASLPSAQISWDPPQDWTGMGEMIIQNAYDYLFLRSGDGAEWVPELAYKWERQDDLTKRFWIEEGVKFHDGTELTTRDIKHLYRRIVEGPRELYIVTAQYDWIDEIIIIDDYTFDVKSKEPHSLLMWQFAQTNNGAGIVSADYFEEVGPEGVHREPMGSGPWRLKEWSRDEFVLFEANDDYWRGRPSFDEFEFRLIPEASTRVAEMLVGNIDIAFDIMAEDEGRLADADGVEPVRVLSAQAWQLYPRIAPHPDHLGEPDFDREFTTSDPRIREAIEFAIDKYQLIELEGGFGEPLRTRLARPLAYAHPDLYGDKANLYDPDRARELIAEAGYGPGEAQLVFDSMEPRPAGDIARVITDMLEDVGFSVDLRLQDESTFRSEIYHPRKTQELMLWQLGGSLNPFFGTSIFTSSRLETDYGGIDSGSEALDSLIHIAWTEVHDVDRRTDAYHSAMQIIAEERYVIGLFQRSSLWGVSDRIEWTPRFDNDVYGWDITPAG